MELKMDLENFDIRSQEFYYHVSPINLEVGSVIKKGNWGRVIRLYWGNCIGLNLFRERVFEDVRLRNFQSKPSRLDCSFLLLNQADAFRYLKVDNEACRTSLIYKVKVCDDSAPSHLGNFNKVTVQPPDCHFQKMDEIATNYWMGIGLSDITPTLNPATNTFEPVTTIELLVNSDIQIVECLNLT